MTQTVEPQVNWSQDKMIEVKLNEPDDFLKVRETLTRIGVASRKEKKLYQSCHILHKQGKYYIVHFKELFALDGKYANLTVNDVQRRNRIARLLSDWGLISVVKEDSIQDIAPLNQIKVLPYKDKHEWTLEQKYNIGKKTKVEESQPAKQRFPTPFLDKSCIISNGCRKGPHNNKLAFKGGNHGKPTKISCCGFTSTNGRISKNSIGLDTVFEDFFNVTQEAYPPYNLIHVNNVESRLEIALAGFKKKEIKVFTEYGKLHVEGSKEAKEDDRDQFLHRGLAQRSFERAWTITDDTEIKSVDFEDGLLTIKLGKIVPEHHSRKDWL